MPFRVSDGNARLSGLITFGNYFWREMPQTGQGGQTGQTGRTGKLGQPGQRGHTKLTFKLDFLDNFFSAAFANLAMF